MICINCKNEIMDGAAFCPYCGEKVTQAVQQDSGPETPVYQADVKRALRPAGKLLVYRDRTEFVTSSVQKAVFDYTGLVAVKKGRLDSIDFITEDGHTETCPADRKCVHEAFLYIEQAVRPYLARRKERLLSEGVRYSFPSSQGLLNDGVLNLSCGQAEFRAKSGKNEVISYEDIKSVSAPGGTLDFALFGGIVKSFAVSKELRNEALTFVTESVAPYLARRKEALLSQGIYFSSDSSDGGTVDILADRVEYKNREGQTVFTVFFETVRAAGLSGVNLELALVDGTTKLFLIDGAIAREVLAFVNNAIEPYVSARTVGFDDAFGTDEQLEFNDQRGVFHILRQNGREITDEWPTDALIRCEWTENTELNTLGSMVSGGISLFKSAAKAAGSQTAVETEERISSAGVVLTLRGESDVLTQNVWFGIFPMGMSRSNKKFPQYLADWTDLSDYLSIHCPECELIEPVLPAIPEEELPVPEAALPAPETALPIPELAFTIPGFLPERTEGTPSQPENTVLTTAEASGNLSLQQDDLGIAKYIEGISRFIGNCTTPMTIAFQGNRVIGGNSMLKMLFDRLRTSYGDNLLWLNARQLPQGSSVEEQTVLIGKKLLGLLASENGSAKQTEALLTNLAAFVSGTIAGDSAIGKDVVGGFLNRNSADSLEDLVKAFSKQLEERGEKVVLFVDGLNQLPSRRAVELLDAARDFFGCRGCVFIIAADYADILNGARELYGESKAKSFFDGLFQMTFRFSASGYDMQNHIKNKIENLGIQAEDEDEPELYASLIQCSVGKDAEAIDRLFVSFRLLQDLTGEDVYANRYKRLALFALLCMQTRFRDAYDYAMDRKDDVTPEFLTGLCGESSQPWNPEQTEEEMAAYRDFGRVFSQIVNLDNDRSISETECRAFADVLELSGVTSR